LAMGSDRSKVIIASESLAGVNDSGSVSAAARAASSSNPIPRSSRARNRMAALSTETPDQPQERTNHRSAGSIGLHDVTPRPEFWYLPSLGTNRHSSSPN